MPHFDAPLGEYVREAEALAAAVRAQSFPALQRVWSWHPAYIGQPLSAIPHDSFDVAAARQTVACEYGCDTWDALETLVSGIADGGTVRAFEIAAEAVAHGDVDGLDRMLQATPQLAHARSPRRHRATLLHYVAANGVEPPRQSGSPHAVRVAECLLDHGAAVDALACFYDEDASTLALVVSTSSLGDPQTTLALRLVERGASLAAQPSGRRRSMVVMALAFGHAATAQALAARLTRLESLPEAAGLGRLDDMDRLLPDAPSLDRQIALTLAALHGQTAAVVQLLAAGVDPNHLNPVGFHGHSTPLHQAVSAGHLEAARALVDRGARLDITDTIYEGTALDWAEHTGRSEIAAFLRARL